MPATVRRKNPPKAASLSERQIHLIAKALADPRRHQILQQVGSQRKGVLCADVRDRQPVTAPTLSHHIKELENAGLVEVAREGKCMRLSLQREVLQAYLNYLQSI
ncbi:MAG: helix-turn-helix domain-containing protein [Terriglobales bacterium]